MNPVRDELLTVAQDLHLRCATVGLQILAGPKLRERLSGTAHHQKLRGISDARRKRLAETAPRRFANPVRNILVANIAIDSDDFAAPHACVLPVRVLFAPAVDLLERGIDTTLVTVLV